ncbi:MAG: hypothetical protein IKZ60_01465 [Bacteroidales bacterium]|nr:hypothetical protein [Bacteroidales bacterium]
MKNSTQNNIKWLSIVILIIATVNIAFIYAATISKIWIQDAIVWNQDKLAWQYFIIAGRFVGFGLLYIFCCIFLIRTNKAIKNGIIFPKSNIALIRWTALVSVLTTFVQSNYDDVIQGATCSVLNSNTIFIPLAILLFAGLYKMAYLAAEDSSLAI